MDAQGPFPKIMCNAREDLAGNIGGEFSPEAWEKILARAHRELVRSEKSESEAWLDVIRDFHRQRYWGFSPDYRKPRVSREEENLGVRFIWYSFRSFLLTKVAVVWFGALYAKGDDPVYKWLFFGAIAFMIANYGYFLFRYGPRHKG